MCAYDALWVPEKIESNTTYTDIPDTHQSTRNRYHLDRYGQVVAKTPLLICKVSLVLPSHTPSPRHGEDTWFGN